MEDANTISACHFNIFGGVATIDEREYNWHIPKQLRSANIKKGDVVLVESRQKKKRVIVVKVFREDIEETGKSYSSVISKIPTPPELINLFKQEK